jgi:pimeloyl-ACP methyl ester carboxylesterase
MGILWRERRFKGIDGSDLYYRIAGSDQKRWAVLCDGIGCDGYMWRYITPQLLDNGYRVLHWNYPGHGLSGPAIDEQAIGIADFAAHLQSLCNEVGVEKPLLMGHSMGVQVALQAWRDGLQVEALALVFGAAGRILDQYGGNDRLGRYLPMIRAGIAARKDLVNLVWKTLVPTRIGLAIGLMTELNAMRIRPADFMPYLERLSGMDPEVFFAVLARAAEHDARPWLCEVDVPTQILAGDADSFTPPRLSRAMHAALPDSRLTILRQASHAGPLEFPEELAERLQDFLDELELRRKPKRRKNSK